MTNKFVWDLGKAVSHVEENADWDLDICSTVKNEDDIKRYSQCVPGLFVLSRLCPFWNNEKLSAAALKHIHECHAASMWPVVGLLDTAAQSTRRPDVVNFCMKGGGRNEGCWSDGPRQNRDAGNGYRSCIDCCDPTHGAGGRSECFTPHRTWKRCCGFINKEGLVHRIPPIDDPIGKESVDTIRRVREQLRHGCKRTQKTDRASFVERRESGRRALDAWLDEVRNEESIN